MPAPGEPPNWGFLVSGFECSLGALADVVAIACTMCL